jgi:diaminopimelate epimerase
MKFTKMHALGNDYVVVDCLRQAINDPEALSKAVSDRHLGIGSDGMILICPSKAAGVRMRMFNADGSEAEMCGNGIRCTAKYVYERRLCRPGGALTVPGGKKAFPASLSIETGKGILAVGLSADSEDTVRTICVNMGRPVLEPGLIPVDLPGDRVIQRPATIGTRKLLINCVSMGNPHAVFFCDDAEAEDLARIGPVVENHDMFPNRTNVHFATVRGPREILVKTWERGSGITLACGTGAAAVCVAAALAGLSDRSITAVLPGGRLEIEWSQQDECVYMTGPAEEVFEGTFKKGTLYFSPGRDQPT